MSDEQQTAAEAQGNGVPDLDTSAVDAEEFAKNMATVTDEQLSEALSGPMRETILGEIFNRMEQHFKPDAARDTEAVIQFRIGGRSDGGHDEYEVTITGATCDAHLGFTTDEPRVSFQIDGVDFLRLVTGNASGPMLFMSGKLKIQGDMLFAPQIMGLFKVPSSG